VERFHSPTVPCVGKALARGRAASGLVNHVEELSGDFPRDVALVIHTKGILLKFPAGKAVAQPPAGSGAFRVWAAPGPAPGAGVMFLDHGLSLLIRHMGEVSELFSDPIMNICFHGDGLGQTRWQKKLRAL